MTTLLLFGLNAGAIGLLIWLLIRKAEQAGERGVKAAINEKALEVLKDANEVENDVAGMSRAELERVSRGPQSDN